MNQQERAEGTELRSLTTEENLRWGSLAEATGVERTILVNNPVLNFFGLRPSAFFRISGDSAFGFPFLFLASLFLGLIQSPAADWPTALATMPLSTTHAPSASPLRLGRTNCVPLLLAAFQSNSTVKALIFMPGATDELYMFRRASAVVTNSTPSLLDAIVALTNQTHILATFRPPLLLLHSAEDPLEPIVDIQHQGTAAALHERFFQPHACFNDRDWDTLQPVLKKWSGLGVKPWQKSYDSWHFYRHSFAAWNLTGWEALEATALAGKTRVTLTRNQAVFDLDRRFRQTPRLEKFPE